MTFKSSDESSNNPEELLSELPEAKEVDFFNVEGSDLIGEKEDAVICLLLLSSSAENGWLSL